MVTEKQRLEDLECLDHVVNWTVLRVCGDKAKIKDIKDLLQMKINWLTELGI